MLVALSADTHKFVKAVGMPDRLVRFRIALLFALERSRGLGYFSRDTREAKDRNL